MGTYCGKSCADCTWKELHQCPECRLGPGKTWGGDCDIARCCREKGHETCATCVIGQRGCSKRSNRENMPSVRQNLIEIKAAREAEAAAQAPVLGKWLWIIFWLIVPGVIADLMTQEVFLEGLPSLRIPCVILTALCNVGYGFALLKLKGIREQYGTSGLWAIIGAGIALLLALIPNEKEGLLLLLSLPAIAVGLWGEYNEYMAHASVLEGVATELCEKWKQLWKWYAGLLFGTLGCLVLALLAPVLGLLGLLAVGIGMVVTGILKLIYLYRTAKLFRDYQPEGGAV